MSTIPTYPVNTQVRFTVAAFNISGQLADPNSMLFMTGGPDGSSHSVTATRDSTGNWHTDFVTATPGGKWWYRFVATGAVQGQTLDTPYNVQVTQF